MTPEQKRLVRTSFQQVRPVGDDFAAWFRSCLFDLDPGLEQVFTSDARPGRGLIRAICLSIKGLYWWERIKPKLQAVGSEYARLGIDEYDYRCFRQALVWALERCLGAAFTPELRTAWTAFWEMLAGTMQNRPGTVPESDLRVRFHTPNRDPHAERHVTQTVSLRSGWRAFNVQRKLTVCVTFSSSLAAVER